MKSFLSLEQAVWGDTGSTTIFFYLSIHIMLSVGIGIRVRGRTGKFETIQKPKSQTNVDKVYKTSLPNCSNSRSSNTCRYSTSHSFATL